MKKSIYIYVICILAVEAAGLIVGMMTREGTRIYAETIKKPALSPPGIAFPIAWTILYALMGIGLARVIMSTASTLRTTAISLFVLQLILNLAWCFIFFGAKRFDIALIELIVMFATVIAMTITFLKIDKTAGMIQIPYILWLCFAMYLNYGVMRLN